MTTWSIRTAAVLAVGACACGIFAAPATAQVSAANTIAPSATVVAQPKPTAPTAPTSTAKPKVTTTTKAKTAKAATTTTVVSAVAADTDAVDPDYATPSTVAPELANFTDPLADLAAAALAVVPAAGTAPAGATLVAAPAMQSVQYVVTPSTVAPSNNMPKPPTETGWTSAVISTDDLAQFVTGEAISAPVSQQSQAVLAALPTVGSDRYMALLKAMAKIVGPRTKTDPAALEAVWVRTDGRRMKAVLTAMAQVGTRYRFTGNKPGGFDCSGLTSYSWSQAGVKIPRTSTLQYQGLNRKSESQLLPGDLVWHPGHVAMYLGAGQAIVHAPQTGKTVEVRASSSRGWNSFLSPL